MIKPSKQDTLFMAWSCCMCRLNRMKSPIECTADSTGESSSVNVMKVILASSVFKNAIVKEELVLLDASVALRPTAPADA
mmetsp:Transcript_40169/g.70688  ORF Transcript_40169/g.70688 Transcript_40169/m.70688 type:complete len:80 (+) Transcript_40169:57-296(+)